MTRKSASDMIERLLNDPEFVRTVAAAQNDPALQQRLKEEYGLSESAMTKALFQKFPLEDEVLDEIHGGRLSDLTVKRVLRKAIIGATGGAIVGSAGGPEGSLAGGVIGAIGVAGADIFEEAVDSLLSWKW